MDSLGTSNLPSIGFSISRRTAELSISFGVSITLHFALVTLMMLISLAPRWEPSEVEAVPLERRALRLKFNDLPLVTPPSDFQRAETSQGKIMVQKNSAVTKGLQPDASRFVMAPPVLEPSLVEFPAPDEIRVALPLPPPAQKQPAKLFTPPAPVAAERRPSQVLDTASLPVVPENSPTFDSPKLPGARRIVPPVQIRQSAAPAAAGPLDLMAPPPVASSPMGLPGASTLIVLNSSPLSAPPPPTPPSPSGAAISRGHSVGPAAVRGDSRAPGLAVPGVAVDGAGKPSASPAGPLPAASSVAPPAIVYRPSRLGAAQNATAAPLRPFSRTIPAHVERMFAGRNVFTILLPMGATEGYQSDWVVWFGERIPVSADGRIAAPVPLIKRTITGANSHSQPGPIRVRASAILAVDGTLRDLKILSCSIPAAAPGAVADLMSWTFRPVSRDGAPVESDLLIDLTLR